MAQPPSYQQGGYPAPQQQAGYPPPQQQGGYPPPQQQGGYPHPQQQGGYPPPQQQGGYPPPQQQGGHPGSSQQGLPPSQPPQQGADPWKPGSGQDVLMDNLPAAPPEDNENVQEQEFRPQADGLKSVDGYGNIGFENGGCLPPPSAPPPEYESPPAIDFGTGANITVEEAREALLEKVAEHCCWGKRAAEGLQMHDITPSDAMHYKLETFSEGRSTARVEVPFPGGPVDGPEYGPAPLPWDIPCQPNGLFSNQMYNLEVPHTAFVRMCDCCMGRGWNRCSRCHGCGRVRCSSCFGRGHRTVHRDGHSHHETCTWCHGSGSRYCSACGGDGRVTCRYCKGYRFVKNFIQLTVSYTNHVSDYILEETDMPDELVKDVGGVQLMQQTALQVAPVTAFPVRAVNENSVRLVESHRTGFPSERILQQRQTLRAVPVTEVACRWKDQNLRYWVYGQERKVHAPDYPHQCCCGCTIL